MSIFVATAPEGFEQAGNLEGTVLSNAELAGTLEGAVLVVNELVDTPAPLGQTPGSPWSPAPPAQAEPVEKEEVPGGGAETEGAGQRLALGMERVKGWKEAVGDTGPQGKVRLEAMPAVWALPSSVSCSRCPLEVRGLKAAMSEEGSRGLDGLLRTAPKWGICGTFFELSSRDSGGWVSWTGMGKLGSSSL